MSAAGPETEARESKRPFAEPELVKRGELKAVAQNGLFSGTFTD